MTGAGRGPATPLKTLKMVVAPPFSEFSKLRLPVPANWPRDETLKTLKMVVTPSFSKFSKFSPGTFAGDCTLRRVEGRLGRGPRRRWMLPGGREAWWGGRDSEAAQMTVMVVVPGADTEKMTVMVRAPGADTEKIAGTNFL